MLCYFCVRMIVSSVNPRIWYPALIRATALACYRQTAWKLWSNKIEQKHFRETLCPKHIASLIIFYIRSFYKTQSTPWNVMHSQNIIFKNKLSQGLIAFFEQDTNWTQVIYHSILICRNGISNCQKVEIYLWWPGLNSSLQISPKPTQLFNSNREPLIFISYSKSFLHRSQNADPK